MMRDLPLPIDLGPHVRETRLNRGAIARFAQLEGVQAGVEVGVAVVVDLFERERSSACENQSEQDFRKKEGTWTLSSVIVPKGFFITKSLK